VQLDSRHKENRGQASNEYRQYDAGYDHAKDARIQADIARQAAEPI
jgi:hypothetical protein